jgi:hypothetical protein
MKRLQSRLSDIGVFRRWTTVRTTSGYVSSQANGEILTNKTQMLAGWKEHFEENLNEGSESEQPTRPVDLSDDGFDIDLPSREKIEGALKYLKNNKAARVDSIAAELLKNGGPNLVDALQESGPRGYCVQCTRRAINSIVKTFEGFAS